MAHRARGRGRRPERTSVATRHPRGGAAGIAIPHRGVLRARARRHARADARACDRDAERCRLRSDRRAAHAGPCRSRAVARHGAGGQSLCQPRHHRGDRAEAALRRLEAIVGRSRREGRRSELPDRPGQLALEGDGTGLEHPASAWTRLAHHRTHRGGPALAHVRGFRVAPTVGAVGRARLGPRVRPGARRVAPGRRAQPLPLPTGAGRDQGDGGCRMAGAAARGRGGRACRRRVRAVDPGRAAARGEARAR